MPFFKGMRSHISKHITESMKPGGKGRFIHDELPKILGLLNAFINSCRKVCELILFMVLRVQVTMPSITSVNYNFSHRKYRNCVLVQPATDSTVPSRSQHTWITRYAVAHSS